MIPAYTKHRAAVVSGHRYYRLNISASAASPLIYEMPLRIVSGGASVATGGTASASSTLSSNVPANAFDGNTSTYWEANAGVPQQLEYDFGSGVTNKIVEYALYTVGGFHSPTGWTLEHSDDGSTWTVCDTRSGVTLTASTYNTFTVASP